MKTYTLKLGDSELIIEIKDIARQSQGSVLVKIGETVVLTTAVSSPSKEKTDFLPLLVEYREQTFAAGKIPGGFIKREGRPRDKEIIYGRAIDRSIRPHFPPDFTDEVEIVSFLLSYDMEQEGDLLGIIGASCALSISDIPFNGPIGAVRVGRINGKLKINPKRSELEISDFNLLLAGKKEGICMIEFQGNEIKEEDIIEAYKFAVPYIEELIELQEKIQKEIGKEKYDYKKIEIDKEIIERINNYRDELRKKLFIQEKVLRTKALDELREKIKKEVLKDFPDKLVEINIVLNNLEKDIVRERTVKEKIRMDGRSLNEIRPIWCEISVLPRTHGSAIFTRGETQALCVTTLGTKEDAQKLGELEGEEVKRFMLHYMFPGFSTGEVAPLKGPSRREIGHGNLAEKAIEPLIPPEEKFPYTIRVVSLILESNGSTSMASVCGASLSLMDAGIPIKSACAGISIGWMDYEGEDVLLSDIIGSEDHFGNMDFKVAGTDKGITAIQLDIKKPYLPLSIFEKALFEAKKAREFILQTMSRTINKPRSSISKYAPKVRAFLIPKEKIGEVIGPSGRVIKRIIEKTNVKIDIDDTKGEVFIYGENSENVEEAQKLIEEIVQDIEIGRNYKGKVTRVENFGVFIEILPGKIGLVHVSEWAPYRIKDLNKEVKPGDEVIVKVIGIDELGRIRLSRKRALEENRKKENLKITE
ncbi:MAG: polyribonucleotide nucleotidyltransferase [candidate division WOR-3 bacterium]